MKPSSPPALRTQSESEATTRNAILVRVILTALPRVENGQHHSRISEGAGG